MKKSSHILIVEDDLALRGALKSGIEAAGFGVSVASSADEARDLVKNTRFDLILTDIGIDGDESGVMFVMDLQSTIRASGGSLIPVVILTGHVLGDAVKSKLMEKVGVELIMVKPAKFGDLLGFIRKKLA